MFQNKKDLRRYIKALKSTEDRSEWMDKSKSIFSLVEQLEAFASASNILAYWSLDDEVITHPFIQKWLTGKRVFLPVVKGDDLRIVPFEGIANMEPEPVFGIMEPTSEVAVSIDQIDFIVVPGLAFDRECRRLGRGKGYYDRLLQDSNAAKVGVGFNFQIVEQVPVECYDVAMDMVVTESDIFSK